MYKENSADATAYRLFSRHYENIEGTAQEPYLVVDGNRYPIINRFTRNFDQKIYMIGGNPAAVEHVELNPNSPLLQSIYNELRSQIENTDSTADILGKALKATQFHLPNYDETDQLIFETLNQSQNSRIIDFDHFIIAKVGKCRHHALLNAYFLSRLVNEGLLQGQVMFHGQWRDLQEDHKIQKVGHAFDIFIDEKTGLVHVLDSLFGCTFSISQNPNNPLFQLYRCNSIDDTIRERLIQFEQDENIRNVLNHVFSLPKTYAAAVKTRINRQRFESLMLLSEEAYRVGASNWLSQLCHLFLDAKISAGLL